MGRRAEESRQYNAPAALSALEIFASNFHPDADSSESAPNATGAGASAARSVLSVVPTVQKNRDGGPAATATPSSSSSAAAAASCPPQQPPQPQQQQAAAAEECTATIFEAGSLGLEFVQQADRVVVHSVRPGSVAAKLPFPKIKKGMQLLRVHGKGKRSLYLCCLFYVRKFHPWNEINLNLPRQVRDKHNKPGSLRQRGPVPRAAEDGGEITVRPPATAWGARLSRMPRPVTLALLKPGVRPGMQTTIDSMFG